MPKYKKGSIVNVKCKCGHIQQTSMKNITRQLPDGLCVFCKESLRNSKILEKPKY